MARTSEPAFLAIPSNHKDLADLVLKLLGKGRLIEKTIEASFSITLQDLINLHHTIDQRVTLQNSASLSTFESRFEFADGHTFVVTSINDFLNTAFIQTSPCVKATLSWIYIVTFAGRTPERQRIDISFHTSAQNSASTLKSIKTSPSIRNISFYDWSIEHTEVTWGLDLSRHIEHYLSNFAIRESKALRRIRTVLNEHEKTISLLGSSLIGIWHMNANLNARLTSDSTRLNLSSLLAESPATLDLLDRKITFLLDRGKDFSLVPLMLPLVFGLFAFFLSLFFADRLLSRFNSGSIILNDAMQKAHDRVKSDHNRSRFYSFVAFSLSILSGIFGNTIYDFLKMYFPRLLG